MSTILAPRGRGIKLCLKILCRLGLIFIALCNSRIILLVFSLIQNMLSIRGMNAYKDSNNLCKNAVF